MVIFSCNGFFKGREQYFVFGDVAYPRNVKTNLTVYGKQNDYYTLESLLLLWENREMQHTAYVKDASGKGIQCVTRPDRLVYPIYIFSIILCFPVHHFLFDATDTRLRKLWN